MPITIITKRKCMFLTFKLIKKRVKSMYTCIELKITFISTENQWHSS